MKAVPGEGRRGANALGQDVARGILRALTLPALVVTSIADDPRRGS